MRYGIHAVCVVLVMIMGAGATGEDVCQPGIAPGRAFFDDHGLAHGLIAEFTGDGRPDLVLTSDAANRLRPQLPDGTFGAARPLPIIGPVVGIVSGDVNADGACDLIACVWNETPAAASVWVLLNDGLGTFEASTFVPPAGTISPVLLDVDGDGALDLVATMVDEPNATGGVAVFHGHGDGTFDAASLLGPVAPMYRIVAIDVNRDGRTDLVTSGTPASVLYVFVGTAGGFEPAEIVPAPVSPYRLQAGMFDGDDAPDLVLGASGESHVAWNDGQGGFRFELLNDDLGHKILVGDFNGDDQPDVLLPDDETSLILLNLGNRMFEPTPIDLDAVGSFTAGLAGDLDRDGIDDLIIRAHGQCNVYRGRSSGDFGVRTIVMEQGGTTDHVIVRDFNGDGLPDFAVQPSFGSSTVLYAGTTDGRFVALSEVPLCVGHTMEDAADLDADGDIDLITSYEQKLYLRWNDGSGHMTTTTAMSTSGGGDIGRVRAGDLDGDGDPDIVVVFWGSTLLRVFRNDGNRSFFGGQVDVLPGAATGIALADVNGDGSLDAIVTCTPVDLVTVLLNDGRGGLDRVQDLANNAPAKVYEDVSVGDLDGDGFVDLVAASAYTTNDDCVAWFGSASGVFGDEMDFDFPTDLSRVQIVDVDDDGRPDLAATVKKQAGSLLYVMFNGGDRTFVGPVPFAGPAGDFVDLDGDGRLDRLGIRSGNITIYRNDACPRADLDGDGAIGSFDLAILLALWGECPSCLADLDHDDDVDAADLALLLARWNTP